MGRVESEYSVGEILEIIRSKEFAIDVDFRGKDILSMEQFSKAAIYRVMERARLLEAISEQERAGILAHRNIAVLFFEPSSRTFGSFMFAAKNLGMDAVGIQGMVDLSSVSKGETLEDTVKTYEAYAEAIVIRHPQRSSAMAAAVAARVPIINGGNGTFEHPTQALLDYYTILKETDKRIEDLHFVFMGDLLNGRTVHSLVKLLEKMGGGRGIGHMSFVSPEVVRLPDGLKNWLIEQGVSLSETTDLSEVASYADILYVTRVQKERFNSLESYQEATKGSKVTLETMGLLKPNAVVMHPLPRVDEIAVEVDKDPRAAYFRQVENGLPIRMALLTLVLGV